MAMRIEEPARRLGVMQRVPVVGFGLFLLAMLAVSSCTTPQPAATSNVVYIADFDLELAPVQHSGPASAPKPAPLGERLGYGRPAVERTPEQQERDLVDLMSRSLLNDLQRAGIPAQRLPPGAPLPSSGWLVRGTFLDLDAGGRLRRPVALGAGSTQEVIATIDQLGAAAPQPLYKIDGAAQDAKSPEAVVTPNPNIASGRFVLTPRDLERNVVGAAQDITEQLKMRMGVGNPDTSESS